ncbi:MAG: murein L,D-transpeptidase catalytic domain family protein [Candidatus Berkiellales bacterium]
MWKILRTMVKSKVNFVTCYCVTSLFKIILSSLFVVLLTLLPLTSQAKFFFQSAQLTKQIAPNILSLKKSIKEINPRVLELALAAQQKAQAMGVTSKPILTIIDYSLPATKPRLWVVDVARGKVVYHTHVAHGSGSGGDVANRFSDVPGSLQTSLGVFVTGKTYHGKHGNSLTLHGLEKGINGNAEKRRIVIHAAHYVGESYIKSTGRLGRSWGCPALSTHLAQPIIHTIKEGSLLFAYYPDKKWLNRSQFLP